MVPKSATCEESAAGLTGLGPPARIEAFAGGAMVLPVHVGEFWTARQRQAHRLHEVSYRACFKPQLPRFFIERLTRPGEAVLDPFMGRGTTLLEAALLGRRPLGVDINPLSAILVRPRLDPPTDDEVARRLARVDLETAVDGVPEALEVFFHPETLRQIAALRAYLAGRRGSGNEDRVDAWIRMVATGRLTGHSAGFFSVYTLPPNQAVSVESQRRINARLGQKPTPRDVRALIQRKSRALLRDLQPLEREHLRGAAAASVIATGSADELPGIADESVQLVVTSPPFLDVVDYQGDNWLRCWFNDIDERAVPVWRLRRSEDWQAAMQRVFAALRRVLVPGGWAAFEVGEVRGGSLPLEQLVVPAARAAGLTPRRVLINDQDFTKTSNCWGVSNRARGTNTNRIVLLENAG